ncbi:alpha/beta fold hydrolase [Dongia deserti]|uniref:alpha/beta fold hydrolase n=1 Tax=Dongia deserti TaxID=2268030 RepID=UPI000E649A2C|nr:alpha/beta fold hydrolase [Dongia deserti]
MLAMALWGNSAAAWPSLKAAWQNSNEPGPPSPLASALRALAPELQKADETILLNALTLEGQRRLGRFLDGVLAYRRYPGARRSSDRPVLWREGTTLLRDYRRNNDAVAPRLLVVPSLINRYYILDLEPESSFLADLAARGYAPFVVDWDAPGPEEQTFDLTRYIAGRLEGALDAVKRQPGGPIIIIGYCMGGNLALALALRRQSDIAALACLATPWDFHADSQAQAQLIGAVGRSMDPLFQVLGEMPVDVLQSFFAALDPLSILAKFRRFAEMEGEQARRFVALEDWLNDGVGLAAPVARECLTQWYGENTTANGKWLIAGEPVRPERLNIPALAMVPSADRIVPPKSAMTLAQRLPKCDTLTPAAGHIGMMVGSSARAKVWDPLDAWLRRIAAS